MNAIWAYFTYAENLGIAAGQETSEFPVLAAKLWGEFAPGFWLMITLMGVAFWILIIPQLIPESAERVPVLRPRYAFAFSGGATFMFLMLVSPQFSNQVQVLAAYDMGFLADPVSRTTAWIILFLLLILAVLAASPWLKKRRITASVIASGCVLVGMWLERWNIIVPTLTRPRLIEYSTYQPTLTEISLTAASFALFFLMFLVFFKLFPAVSIWEVMEGRVIQEAHSKVVIPPPEPSETRQPRRRGFNTLQRGG
jgi:hypothetical protein